ncbi:MAG: hypothetical protein KGH75_05340 [Rhodospirillales bacterium]|nr:hypothetical protein [Rhodospirillales bacterium]
MDENLAKDFVAVWQSELTAMAADRELRESWATMLNLWAQVANAAAALLPAAPPPHEPPPRGPGAAEPTGAAPAAAASGSGLDEVQRLNRRVAELEQRLAEFMEQRDRTGPSGAGGAG